MNSPRSAPPTDAVDDSPFYLPALAGFPVVIVQDIAWGDMDAYQHVNNVVYFRYFENARIDYLARLDWMRLREEQGLGPIVASTQARFRKAVAYPDRIAIGARLGELKEDRFTLEHKIVSRAQRDVVTEGAVVVVSFNYRAGGKCPIPEPVLQRLKEMEPTAKS